VICFPVIWAIQKAPNCALKPRTCWFSWLKIPNWFWLFKSSQKVASKHRNCYFLMTQMLLWF
jgi:hypothetical protein